MAWIRNLFRSRPKRVASGPLTLQQAVVVAQGFAVNLMASHGIDLQICGLANTNSMVPTLDANCIALLDACPFDALAEGDIVVYRSALKKNNNLICHRLSERQKKGWWPLGDNNATMDAELVTPENYHRRVVGIIYCKRQPDTDL